MPTDIKYAIEIVDKWQKPLAQFESAIDRINRKKINSVIDDKAVPRVDALNSSLRQTGVHIREIERETRGMNKQIGNTADNTAGWEAALKKVWWVALAIKAVNVFGSFINGSIMAASQVEKYNATLKVMLGSTGAARDRMQEYLDIAAKTPFELQQVIDAGNQLQAIGKYSRENLINIGDLAAASGKPIEQVMAAYAKLSTGQRGEAVNMFRDLLISTDDWVAATGKGIKANGELMASSEEMLAALPAILKAKGFIGMMDTQSKTTIGQISNLKDGFFQLKSVLGEELNPTFGAFLQIGSRAIETLKKAHEIPLALKIAEERSELNALVGAITDANVGEETRLDLMKNLQIQYPDFLGNLNAETVSNEQLMVRLKQVNEQYERKIKLAASSERLSQAEEAYTRINQKIIDLSISKEANEDVIKYGETARQITTMYGYSAEDNTPSLIYRNVKNLLSEYYQGKKDIDDEYLNTLETFAAAFLTVNNGYTNTIYSYEDQLAQLETEKVLAAKNLQKLRGVNSQNERDELYGEASLIDVTDSKVYDKLFNSKSLVSEFKNLVSKSPQELTNEDWQRLSAFMSGDLRYKPDYTPGGPGGGPSGNSFAKAEDAITGGGRNVKNFNITIDNLVGVNNNIFEPGESIENAENFRNRLTALLQSVLNDINYSN